MKLNSYCCLLLVLLVSSQVFSQRKIDPTPDDIQKAKTLKETYEDDDVVLLDAVEEIEFDIDRRTQTVTVKQNQSEHLMNISSRADIQKYNFYNSFSDIEKFQLSYRNKKKADFYVQDDFYQSDEMFYHDARVKYVNVDFPTQGYRYFYNLIKNYKDIKYFTSIYFSGQHPIIEKKVKLIVPDWLTLEIKEFNFEGYDIVKETSHNDKLQATEHTFTIKNMPSDPSEPNILGPSHEKPHILILPKSYEFRKKTLPLFNETKDLYKWYKSLVDSMNEQPESLQAKVKELTENATTDEEKIKNIYYWVQDNIRYIAFEDGIAGFKPDESQNVFKKKYGDCKGMANLIKQMLVIAGFDARLTWIGTKRIAYDYSMPNLSVDNHMICTLIIDGKRYFLDGTEKYNPFGEYADRIQGRPVLIEDNDDFILDKVPTASVTDNKEIYHSKLKIENEELKGSVTKTFTGESRATFLYGYYSIGNDKKEDVLLSFLTRGDKNYIIDNIQNSDLSNREEDVKLSYDLVLKNKVTSFDNEIYIDIDHYQDLKQLDLTERKNDYSFSYKKNMETIVELDIPAGYVVKELPKNIKATTEDFEVSINFSVKGNKIIYHKNFEFKNAVISKKYFTQWNEALKDIKNSYQEQLILVKS